jgi:hypothetical protein
MSAHNAHAGRMILLDDKVCYRPRPEFGHAKAVSRQATSLDLIGLDRSRRSRFYFLRAERADKTSSLCLAGLTPVHTLAILPVGSIRNVLRDE